MKAKRITALLTAVAVASMLVAGCGNEADSQGTQSGAQAATETEAAAVYEEPSDEESLLVGASDLSGVFNPLFAESEADQKVCELIFDTICSVNETGEIEDAAGHLELVEEEDSYSSSYSDDSDEESDEESEEVIEYLLTLDSGLTFSNGEEVTIDDVIFTWMVMADPFYEGVYSLGEVQVQGMQEYYYDTEDVETYLNSISGSYSEGDISEEDFIAYLIDTNLEGWFDGELPGDLDGNGLTWVEYLESNGYDPTGIEDDPDELLKMLAQCEYEHYAFTYDPLSYYEQLSHDALLSGGIEVTEISGIEKIDEYSCKISFLSDDASTLRAMLVIPILSEDYYGADYEKGEIENLEALNGSPVGSGSYVLGIYDGDQAVLEASSTARLQTSCAYVKIKNVADEDKASALSDGTISLASFSPEDEMELSDGLEAVSVEGSGFYYLGINTDRVNSPTIRLALMYLVDKSLLQESDETIAELLETQNSVIANAVSLTTQTWPMTRYSIYYPNIEEILQSRSQGPADDSDTEDSEIGDSEDADFEDADSEEEQYQNGEDDSNGTGSDSDYEESDVYYYSEQTAYSYFSSAGYWLNGDGELVKSSEQLKLTIGISQDLPNAVKAVAYQMKADLEELGVAVTLTEYEDSAMAQVISAAIVDIWIDSFTDITGYDMEDYLHVDGSYNYFHHNDGYEDLLYEDVENSETSAQLDYAISELMEYIMECGYCRPLCTEISEVYVMNTDLLNWTDHDYLNQYDSFAEIISGISLK